MTSEYSGMNILVTGGLGFIGSSVSHELVARGASVTILDNLDPRYGGNIFNIRSIVDRVTVIQGDIRDEALCSSLVVGKHAIFHFAAQVSYIDSSSVPFEDLDINCRGTLNLLEACKKWNPSVKAILASSRLVYGKISQTPVREDHPVNPLSIYAIHKLTCEKYFQMYHALFGMHTVVVRITNPYGTRQQIKHSKYSLPGWFLRQALEGKSIRIFGDGMQRRDYIYIDDLVRIFTSLLEKGVSGEIYNAGLGRSYYFRDMVETIIRTAGRGSIEYVDWPRDYERVETGDYETDISKLTQAIQWAPTITIDDGVARMADYYKQYFKEYIAGND